MEKRFEMVKPVIYGVLMFVLVGIGIAVQILSRVGLSENYPFVVALAALVSGLMLGKHRLTVLVILLGLVAINLPVEEFQSRGIDPDILLALVCSIILTPSIYNLLRR